MAEDSSDLLMKFVEDGDATSGTAIDGASTTVISSKEDGGNPLDKGFEPGKYFEISRFSLSANAPHDASRDRTTKAPAKDKNGNPVQPSAEEKAGGPGDVTFEREFETSSMQMIDNCVVPKMYDNATLIKRKAAGGDATGETYLRLDFQGVVVTSIELSDGDRIKESVTFKFRSVTITYRPQLPDGTLGSQVPGFWSRPPDIQPVILS